MNVYTKLVKFLAVIPFLFAYAFAQVAVNPISQPHQTFVDGSGSPCSGCYVYSYVAGTNTALATYTDSTGTSQNTNPIILDAAGGANIWVGASSYKFILKDALGTTIWTVDNVNSSFLKVSGGTLSGPLTVPTIHVTNLIDNGSGGPPLIGTGIPSGNQAVSASILCSYEPVSSVLCYNAVGDNSTDNTTAFANMESSTTMEFYLPQGIFKTSQTYLTKKYKGPGSIVLGLNANTTQDGDSNSIYNAKTIGLDGLQSYWASFGAISLAILGDSLSTCYPSGSITATNYTGCWAYMMQRYFAGPGRIGQGGLLSGAITERLVLNVSGSSSYGTHGPIGQSLILTSGSSTSISGAFINGIIVTTYNSPGGGVLTISGPGGTWGACNTSAGSGEVKCGSAASPLTSPDGANYQSQSITLACTGGPCEITNFIGATLPSSSGDTVFLQMAAHGGYNTADFNSSSVINSIAFNQLYSDTNSHSIVIIFIGTNSIYNPSKAESPAIFKSNLSGILSKSKSAGMAPIIVIPPQPSTSSTYTTVLAPFPTYHDIYLELAKQYSAEVIDLSNLDLGAGALYGSDGLHATIQGQAAMFDRILKAGFSRSRWVENLLNLPLIANPSATGTANNIQIHDFKGIQSGTLGAFDAATSIFSIGSVNLEANKDLFISSGYPSGTGNVNIATNGRQSTVVINSTGMTLGSSVFIKGSASNPVTIQGGSGTTNDLVVKNTSNVSILQASESGQLTTGASGTAGGIHVWGALSSSALGNSTASTACINTTDDPGWNRLSACTSLRKFKKDISSLRNALSEVMLLKPVSYTSTTSHRREIGFIAEEIEAIDSRNSTYDKSGKLIGVQYDHLTALLVSAIQEQQRQIKVLKYQIMNMQRKIVGK